MTCEVFRQTLDEAFDLVDPEVLGPLRAHAGGCPACEALLQERLRFEQTLTVAMLQPAKRSQRVGAALPWIRYAAVAATMVLGVLAGHRYGMKDLEEEKKDAKESALQQLLKSLVPPVSAAALPTKSNLLTLPGLGKDDSEFSGWMGKFDGVPIRRGPIAWSREESDYVSIDPSEGWSKPGSIKLLHRYYGGTARRKFYLPLGPGSVVRLTCWVKCPDGGAQQNKFLSLGIAGRKDSEPRVGNSLNVFDANPNWRPYCIETSIPLAIDEFEIGFSTSAGDGDYKGYDRASWIDDISIEVIASYPIRIVSVSGDELVFDIEASGVSFSDVKAISSREGFADVFASPVTGHRNRYRVKSKALVKESYSPNPFTGEESPIGIRGKATIGTQTVNFHGGTSIKELISSGS